MKKTLLIFLLLSLSLPAFAQGRNDETLENEDYINVGDVIVEPLSRADMKQQLKVTRGNPEEGTVMSFQSESIGLYHDYDILQDKHRWSFIYFSNGNIRDFEEVRSIEGHYGWNFAENLWLNVFFAVSYNTFEAMTETNPSKVTEEELEDEYSTLIHVGVGLGTRTSFIRDFINIDSLYETWNASITASRMEEPFFNENFAGIGIRADYGIHYRSSSAFHYGLMLSYHLYSMKRSEEFAEEPQPARHLLLSYLSLGVDWSFYW